MFIDLAIGPEVRSQGQATAACPQESEVDVSSGDAPSLGLQPAGSFREKTRFHVFAPAPPRLTLSDLLHLEALISLPGVPVKMGCPGADLATGIPFWWHPLAIL